VFWKFGICPLSSTCANPRVKEERKKERRRETTFVSSNFCTYDHTTYQVGTVWYFRNLHFFPFGRNKKESGTGDWKTAERQLFVLHQILLAYNSSSSKHRCGPPLFRGAFFLPRIPFPSNSGREKKTMTRARVQYSRSSSSSSSSSSSFLGLPRLTMKLTTIFFFLSARIFGTEKVNADETGKPEVGKDPRQIPNWNDYREHFTVLNEDAASRTEISDGNTPWIEHVSWEPRVFVYHNFLSEKETKYLRDEHKKSSAKGETMKTMFKRGQDPIVNVIEQRLSAFVMLPETHGENMFIEKTKKGYPERLELFNFDDEKDKEALKNGGQRFATTALFLNTISEGKGGELVFPLGTERLYDDSNDSYTSTPSACAAKYKLAVEPRVGDAVVWFGAHHNGNDDLKSASMRCDAIADGEEMLTAYKHWRVGRYNHGNFLPDYEKAAGTGPSSGTNTYTHEF